MKKLLLLLVMSIMTSASVYAQHVYFKYNGSDQLVVVGRGLTDSATFRIRISNDYTGDTDWYESGNGKTKWEITSGGKIHHTIAKRYMKPGNILEVRTYNTSGRKTHSFAKRIPCDETQWVVEFTETWFGETVQVISYQSCGGSAPAPTPAPLVCNASVRVASAEASNAVVLAQCSKNVGLQVRVFDAQNGNQLCRNDRFAANPMQAVACDFERNPLVKLSYRVELYSLNGNALGVEAGVINKAPTFNNEPEGGILSEKASTPAKQNKVLGRGFFWQSKVVVQVADGDVDPSEGLRLIPVELVEVKNGVEVVIKSATANSGGQVQFNLEHEYIKPLVFGKPHHSGDLQMGDNLLRVRVYDAYTKPGMKTYKNAGEVTVRLQE